MNTKTFCVAHKNQRTVQLHKFVDLRLNSRYKLRARYIERVEI